jgi:hypothetical protein
VSASSAGSALKAADQAAPRVSRWRALAAYRPLVALLAIVAVNWLLWASAVPFGEAPDEPSHLDVAQFVAAYGRLPTFGPDADMYVRLDQVGIPIEPHALAPPLTYLVDAALIRLLPVPPPAAARLGSLLAGLAAVALTYTFVRTVLPDQRSLALAAAALLAAVPQFSFQTAIVNSDVFALAAVLAVASLWPLVIRPPGALAFGLALGGALLSKYTAYPAAAAAALAACWQMWRAASSRVETDRVGAVALSRALPLLGLIGVGSALVAGSWLLHNWRLYGRPWPFGAAEAAIRALTPAVDVPGGPAARHLWDPDYLQSWWVITYRSFWAGFDRVSLFAPSWVYVALAVALLVAAVGVARALAAWTAPTRVARALWSPTGVLLVGWPVATLLATVGESLGRYYPVHGRYLIGLLPLVSLALVVGWRALVSRRWAAVAPWALVAAIAALNLYCLLAVVVPHYYGPSGTRVTVTVDSPLPGDVPAAPVLIRGWAVVTGRPAWQLGLVGGAPPWHAPADSVAVTIDGERPASLTGVAGVARPDVALALATPAVANAGFVFLWDARTAAPGPHLIEVCADDRAAAESTCVPLPVRVSARELSAPSPRPEWPYSD